MIDVQGWQVWRQLAGSDQPDQPTLLQDLLGSAKGWDDHLKQGIKSPKDPNELFFRMLRNALL